MVTEFDPLSELDRIPDELLGMPPIDIEAIAEHLGVTKIIRGDIDCAGALQPIGRNTFAILLNRNNPAERQRFTCAHEVSHILLDPIYKGRTGKRLSGTSREKLESACNRLATELLMPRSLFEESASAHSWKLSSLPALASQFKASMEATARRYVDTIAEPCVLLTWRQSTNDCKEAMKLYRHHVNRLVRGRWFDISTQIRQYNAVLLKDPSYPLGRVPTYGRICVTYGSSQSFSTFFVNTLAYGYGKNRRVLNAIYPGREASDLLKNNWITSSRVSGTAVPIREAGFGQPA